MRAGHAVCVLLLAAACSAFNSDGRGTADLDDLALVELDDGAACTTEIREAKLQCGERVAYFKKVHESKCGNKELASLMDRITANHRRTKQIQAGMQKAQDALRQAQFESGRIEGTAATSKHKLMETLIAEWRQKNALNKSQKNVKDEMKDKNSLRFKANVATKDAVAHAKKDKTMNQATAKSNEAKGLFAKMVEEKVKIARAEYLAKQNSNGLKITEATVQKMFKKAKSDNDKAIAEVKKVKTTSIKVAEEDKKVTAEETKTAKLEKDASVKEEKHYMKEAKKIGAQTKKSQATMKKTQATVAKLQKEAATANKEVQATGGLDLKALLAQASNLISGPIREE